MTIFDLYFDGDYDATLENGDLAMSEEDTILAQRLASKYQLVFGEWFLNEEEGLPYPTVIFEKGTDLRLIYALFREATLQTKGVDTIKSLVLTPNTDESSLRIEVSVNQGELFTVEVG